MDVKYRRADGSFVAMVNGMPYHVTATDPLFAQAQIDGASAEFEPQPAPLTAEDHRAAMQMTFAQLLIGLVAEGWITEAEGDAWLEGSIPAAARALIGTLPQAQRFAAKARAARPSVVLRNDPLVNALAAAQGRTQAEMDAFFTAYAVA